MLIEYQVQYFKDKKLIQVNYFDVIPEIEIELHKGIKFVFDYWEVWKITKEIVGGGIKN